MSALALKRFQTLLARGPAEKRWRWEMHRALTDVRDDLSGEQPGVREQWLTSRGRRVADERDRLLLRVSAAGSATLHAEDLTELGTDLRRLSSDLARHAQRLTDLAWDDVEMEIGGSE
jgi:hypothetical protein